MAPTTFFIFIAIAAMFAISQVSSANMIASDCCLRTKDKEVPYNIAKCYSHQTTAKGCNIDAIVFVTRKNRRLCAPPNLTWVKDLMAKLDKNKPHFKIHCGR